MEEEKKKVDHFKLPVELGQVLLNYLAERPYKEVFQLLAAVQQLEAVLVDDDNDDDE